MKPQLFTSAKTVKKTTGIIRKEHISIPNPTHNTSRDYSIVYPGVGGRGQETGRRQGEWGEKKKRLDGWTAGNKCKHMFKSGFCESVREWVCRFSFFKHLVSLRAAGFPLTQSVYLKDFVIICKKKSVAARLHRGQTSRELELCGGRPEEKGDFTGGVKGGCIPLWSALSQCSPVQP